MDPIRVPNRTLSSNIIIVGNRTRSGWSQRLLYETSSIYLLFMPAEFYLQVLDAGSSTMEHAVHPAPLGTHGHPWVHPWPPGRTWCSTSSAVHRVQHCGSVRGAHFENCQFRDPGAELVVWLALRPAGVYYWLKELFISRIPPIISRPPGRQCRPCWTCRQGTFYQICPIWRISQIWRIQGHYWSDRQVNRARSRDSVRHRIRTLSGISWYCQSRIVEIPVGNVSI